MTIATLGKPPRMVGLARTIKRMFTTGVNGAWYDPSDFSTMFQNAAGTTPVTAVGQPVGLMLDKSKGLVLGSEVTTNGSFATDTAWTKGAGWSISGDAARTDGTQGTTSYIQQGINGPAGIYLVSVVVTANSGSLRFDIGSNTSGNITGTGVKTAILTKAPSTTTQLYIGAAAGVTCVIDSITVRELPGNHAFNPSGNSANFPVLQQDGTGHYYLAFNGVNQWLQTNSIDFTYGDKMFVSAGVRKLSDAALGSVVGLTTGIASNNGAFRLAAPGSAAPNLAWSAKGTTQVDLTSTTYTAPITSIISGTADIAGSSAVQRINGAQTASSASSLGTGNFSNAALYLGATGGASNWLNGRLYGLVVAGKAASASEIASTEAWLNQKTGAY